MTAGLYLSVKGMPSPPCQLVESFELQAGQARPVTPGVAQIASHGGR